MVIFVQIFLLFFVQHAMSFGSPNFKYDWDIVKNLDPKKDTARQIYTELTSNNRCDIPIFNGKVKSKLFREKYWNKSPFLIRGGAIDWPAAKMWTKEYLIEKYGDIYTQIGTSQGIIRNHGTGNKFVKFGDYVKRVWGSRECKDDLRWCGEENNQSKYGEEKYLFDRDNFMKQATKLGIHREMIYPSFFKTSEIASKEYTTSYVKEVRKKFPWAPILGGPTMTSKQLKTATPYMFLTPKYDRLVGVAMHQHTDGWNAQVKGNGSKLWIMYPPQVRPGPEHPIKSKWCCGEDSWFQKYIPDLLADKSHGPGSLKPLFCVQQTGDVLYVPEWWHHGTLSGPGPTGKSGIVGVANQLTQPSGELRFLYFARYLLDAGNHYADEHMLHNITEDGPVGPIHPKFLPYEKQKQALSLLSAGKQLLRHHMKVGSTSSIEATKQLLNTCMEELRRTYDLKSNETNSFKISETAIYKEAKELAEQQLKSVALDAQASAHLANLADLRNETFTALYHIRNGKGCIHIFLELLFP